jgi:hypothetical protein
LTTPPATPSTTARSTPSASSPAGPPCTAGASLSLDEAKYFLLKASGTVLAWACQPDRGSCSQSFPFKDHRRPGPPVLSKVAGEAKGLVAPLADAGGLYPLVVGGELIDRGYRVDTGPAVNTTQTIAQKKLRLAVGVRPSPAAAMIEAVVSVAAVGATL